MSYHDLECPYCDAELDICHDDGFGYEEGVKHEMSCGKCGKNFVFETSISFNYEPQKADCLNDGEHDWKAITTHPVECTKMKCTSCDSQRNPTEIEMNEIIEKRNKRIVIGKFPDAYAKKWAALSIVIWCPMLDRRLSGFLKQSPKHGQMQ